MIVSTLTSNKDVTPAQIETDWENFCEMFRNPKRTSETQAEYLQMSQAEQGKLKDVGAFVGGAAKHENGKRVVTDRHIVTLDADILPPNFLDNFFPPFKCLVYSTRKHTPSKPRLRICVPLENACTTEQYEPIARAIANNVGIEYFDRCSFTFSQIMYFPSVSKDGEYIFKIFDGVLVNCEKTLANYKDWRNPFEYPRAANDTKNIRRARAKTEKLPPPSTKAGVVGLFCSLYSIGRTIDEFLQHTFEYISDNRYTYLDGTTWGGVIVFDDIHLYSFHASDEHAGKVHNSYDLLLYYMFKGNKKECMNYVANLWDIKEKAQSLLLNTKTDAGDQDENKWIEQLTLSMKTMKPAATLYNCVTILTYATEFKNKFRRNTFAHRLDVVGTLPFEVGEQWRDVDFSRLMLHFERHYAIDSDNTVRQALEIVADNNAYNPLQSMLEQLKWDNVKRLETFFLDCFDVENDKEYVKHATLVWFVGAVKRAYESGCQHDYVLVFCGEQGLRKTTTVRKLALQHDWFAALNTFETKEGAETIAGKWIVEISELAALKRSEIEQVKHFITATSDTFRPAFARNTETRKRQTVFIGTSNTTDFLSDDTGNRRFLPMTFRKKTELTDEFVRQLWAESVHLYKNGALNYATDDIEKLFEKERQNYAHQSNYYITIVEFLNKKIPANYWDLTEMQKKDYSFYQNPATLVNREFVTISELWEELGEKQSKLTIRDKKEIILTLRQLGWYESKKRIKNHQIRGYRKGV